MSSKKYWVAAARGCDFGTLKSKGFTVFYPALDDYVFLESSEENKYLLSKQEELRIKFLRLSSGKGYVQVQEKEVQQMLSVTKDTLLPGSRIKVVDGYCSGLEGYIKTRDGEVLVCEVYGYKRVFEVSLPTSQVALDTTQKEVTP